MGEKTVERLMKILHSRFFLAALCIVLEFGQLMAVFILLYEFLLPITILGWIFHICVLLYLINRDEIPEFKLPWPIILFLLPVIGAFVFMLLSSNKSFACDNALAVCSTINLDYRSLVHHFECGVWMYGTGCIGDMKADFLATVAQSQAVSVDQATLRGWQGLLAELVKVFSPLL